MARDDLLLNGRLGQPYSPFREDETLLIPAGWGPWWLPPAAGMPDWQQRKPVFGATTVDGKQTQSLATPFGTHVAGLWQQVPSAVGNRYEFAAEGQAWSSEAPRPGTLVEPGDVNLQVGIDPTGGMDAESPLIVWGDVMQPLGHWETAHVTAVAEANIMTVFLRSAPVAPKRQQIVFWRNAFLRPVGRFKRAVNIVGVGDTHVTVEPEQPQPGDAVRVTVSSLREIEQADLVVAAPEGRYTAVSDDGGGREKERYVRRYRFTAVETGLYDIRFVGDRGARLLALRLLRVERDVQLVPRTEPRTAYTKVYVLLPPTADESWYAAAARGAFRGRYTIGFSADDAGMGDFDSRHVVAVNPHHWPQVLTESWFKQHYPGVQFTAVVANQPADLEMWLRKWTP